MSDINNNKKSALYFCSSLCRERTLKSVRILRRNSSLLELIANSTNSQVQHKFVKMHSMTDIYTMDLLARAVFYFFPQFKFMWLADQMKVEIRNLDMHTTHTHT